MDPGRWVGERRACRVVATEGRSVPRQARCAAGASCALQRPPARRRRPQGCPGFHGDGGRRSAGPDPFYEAQRRFPAAGRRLGPRRKPHAGTLKGGTCRVGSPGCPGARRGGQGGGGALPARPPWARRDLRRGRWASLRGTGVPIPAPSPGRVSLPRSPPARSIVLPAFPCPSSGSRRFSTWPGLPPGPIWVLQHSPSLGMCVSLARPLSLSACLLSLSGRKSRGGGGGESLPLGEGTGGSRQGLPGRLPGPPAVLGVG